MNMIDTEQQEIAQLLFLADFLGLCTAKVFHCLKVKYIKLSLKQKIMTRFSTKFIHLFQNLESFTL